MLRLLVDFPNLHGHSLEHAGGGILAFVYPEGDSCRSIVSLSTRSYFVCITMAGAIQFVGCGRSVHVPL